MRARFLIPFVALALVISGCGGSGLLNPFIGTFSGTWSQPSPSDTGTADIVVIPGGTLSGQLHDNGANSDYTISGSISGGGSINAILTPTAGPSQTMTGPVGYDASNHLVGTLTVSGGTLNTINIDLTPQ